MNPTETHASDESDMPENFYAWNEHLALSLANEEGITLADAHWEVLHFLRQLCLANGPACGSRFLLKQLSRHFDYKGGQQYLHALFPRGPVIQACKIAGVPLALHPTDQSPRSVH